MELFWKLSGIWDCDNISKGFYSTGNFSIPACNDLLIRICEFAVALDWWVISENSWMDSQTTLVKFLSLFLTHCWELIMKSVAMLWGVRSQYYTCCCWRSLNMYMAVATLSNPFSVFGLVFILCSVGIGLLFIMLVDLLLCCIVGHLSILFRLTWTVWRNCQQLLIFRNLQYLETICNIKVKLIWNSFMVLL